VHLVFINNVLHVWQELMQKKKKNAEQLIAYLKKEIFVKRGEKNTPGPDEAIACSFSERLNARVRICPFMWCEREVWDIAKRRQST